MENITEKDPIWKHNGTQFVESVTKLLERLLDYRSVMQVIKNKDIETSVWYETEVKHVCINIINESIFKETLHLHIKYKQCLINILGILP